MRLKDRFLEILEVTDRNFQNEDAKCFEKIADDYAIEFITWCIENELYYSIKYHRISLKELLEIFKK